jgi:hypothetical protein
MSLTSASILKDGTIAVTGGTATPFTRLSGDNTSAKASFDGTDFLSRLVAVFTRKEPKTNAGSPDGYTQIRRNVFLKIPRTLASGSLTYDTVKIEFARSVETTAAQLATTKVYAAQLIQDSDFDEFWEEGSLD